MIPSTPSPTLSSKPPSPPQQTDCNVKENLKYGDIVSISVVCLATNVYPEAACQFYRSKDGGSPNRITTPYEYTQSFNGTFYNTECTTTMFVTDLRAGTHTFQAYVYPNVTGGLSLVKASNPTQNVTLYFPRASHSCPPTLLEDYLCGLPSVCVCELIFDGWPKGFASWFREGMSPMAGSLKLSYHNRDLDYTYTCEAVSQLGRMHGSTLKIGSKTSCG